MSTSSYQQTLSAGDALGSLRIAVLTGSLWAIGSAWALSIREIVVAILPVEANSIKVLAEFLAAAITTVLGIGVSAMAVRCCKFRNVTAPSEPSAASAKNGWPSRPLHR